MTIRAITTTAVTAAAFASATATANHIDFIVDGPFTLDDGGSIVVSGDEANILGGERYVAVDSVDATAQLSPGGSVITFNALGTTEATLTLSYGNFVGGSPLNADFESMWNAIMIDFSEVTGQVMLSVEFESSTGSGISAQNSVTGPGSYEFGFNQPLYNGVDFSDVDAVTLIVNLTPGSSFSLESITRVPAPASALGLGLVSLAAWRRRR